MAVALTRERLETQFGEPIFALEMRRFGKRALWSMIVLGVLMGAGTTVAVWFCPDAEAGRVALVVSAAVYMFVITAVTPAFGARSITRERDSGTWDMLSITRMKSGHIADQKILSAAMPMLVLLVAGMPAAVIGTATGGVSVFEAAGIGITLVLATLVVSAWSVETSSDCGSGAIAVAVAYAPLASSICLLGYLVSLAVLVTALVALINRATRARAWRVVASGFCLQFGQGACVLPMLLLVGRYFPSASTPALWWLPCAVLVQVLMLLTMRFILARSIERQRRV